MGRSEIGKNNMKARMNPVLYQWFLYQWRNGMDMNNDFTVLKMLATSHECAAEKSETSDAKICEVSFQHHVHSYGMRWRGQMLVRVKFIISTFKTTAVDQSAVQNIGPDDRI